jgi:tRNA threonylcarbamoyladenosine biosynthesis protein TsaE
MPHADSMRSELTLTAHDEASTREIAARLAAVLRAGDVVTIAGELGAGKTRFVKGLASALGHDAEAVHSPTYVIGHEYDTPGASLPLMHADAYRLRANEAELDERDNAAAHTQAASVRRSAVDDEHLAADLGLDDDGPGRAVLAIEWPERAPGLGALATIAVSIEHAGDTTRRITIATVDDRAVRLADE